MQAMTLESKARTLVESFMPSKKKNYTNELHMRHAQSTEDTIIALTILLIEEQDNRKKCISVFLDLKKAFDTVSIPILIHKLEMMGIRGI